MVRLSPGTLSQRSCAPAPNRGRWNGRSRLRGTNGGRNGLLPRPTRLNIGSPMGLKPPWAASLASPWRSCPGRAYRHGRLLRDAYPRLCGVNPAKNARQATIRTLRVSSQAHRPEVPVRAESPSGRDGLREDERCSARAQGREVPRRAGLEQTCSCCLRP